MKFKGMNRSFSSLSVDLYELTMAQVYVKEGLTGNAVFEVYIRDLPEDRGYAVYAGLAPAIEFVKNLRFKQDEIAYLESLKIFKPYFLDYLSNLKFEGKIYSLKEGTIATHTIPILAIEAPLPVAQILESSVLNLITFETLIATKASRIRSIAPDKLLVDFGLRRVHGIEAGYHVARASFIGGFDGTSNLFAGKELGIPVYGTMAHSYILAFGDEVQAFKKYAEEYENIVLLVDTFDTKKGIENAVKVAKEIEKTGKFLRAIRIDSGNLLKETKMARSILDRSGLKDVKIMLSGSLDEYSIQMLLKNGAPADAFGIGTKLGTSADIPYLDTAYKLVEFMGKGVLKTSEKKETIPYLKTLRRFNKKGKIYYLIGKRGEELEGEEMLKEVYNSEKGEIGVSSVEESKKNFEKEFEALPEIYKKIRKPEKIGVRLTPLLKDEIKRIKREIWKK
jgi:nicotinate phosphoribosyltransferase